MAAPIRPPVWPPAPHIQPGRADRGLSAQKAFFEAALAGKPPPISAQAAAASTADAPRAAPAQAIRAATQVEANTAADKLPRPGSIVDIYV